MSSCDAGRRSISGACRQGQTRCIQSGDSPITTRAATVEKRARAGASTISARGDLVEIGACSCSCQLKRQPESTRRGLAPRRRCPSRRAGSGGSKDRRRRSRGRYSRTSVPSGSVGGELEDGRRDSSPRTSSRVEHRHALGHDASILRRFNFEVAPVTPRRPGRRYDNDGCDVRCNERAQLAVTEVD